jgi:cation:H+ antiporter
MRGANVFKDWKFLLILSVILSSMLIGFWISFDLTVGIALLILGIVVLAFSAEKAVEHSTIIAFALGISPLMIGLLVVSLGTDFPEIMNSFISSALGHGDINVGDSLGSVLAQMTLVLGLLPFVGCCFKVSREEIVVLGGCEILALIASVSMVEKGYYSWLNAVFLIASWPILMLITKSVIKKPEFRSHADNRLIFHIFAAILGFVGVAIGSFIVVQSVITTSRFLYVPEYLISFFVVAIGTSLPELVVDLTAIRKGQFEIAIGDAIGSCLVDAGFSIGIGALFFAPLNLTNGRIAEITGLYALFGSIIVISMLALRRKLDKKAGLLFIIIYLFSYLTLYV